MKRGDAESLSTLQQPQESGREGSRKEDGESCRGRLLDRGVGGHALSRVWILSAALPLPTFFYGPLPHAPRGTPCPLPLFELVCTALMGRLTAVAPELFPSRRCLVAPSALHASLALPLQHFGRVVPLTTCAEAIACLGIIPTLVYLSSRLFLPSCCPCFVPCMSGLVFCLLFTAQGAILFGHSHHAIPVKEPSHSLTPPSLFAERASTRWG